MTQRSAPRLEVVRAEDRHAEALAEFIRQIWDPAATAASVLAARTAAAAHNVAEPGVAPPTWIAVQEGRVLGYVTTIPIRLWDGAQEFPGYWIKGLMVLPEFRGGPIGYLVLKAAVASLPRSGGLAVAAPARRLFQALGYTDLGAVPNWIRPVAPGRIVQRLDFEALGLSGLPAWTPRAVGMARRTGLAALGGWLGGVALRGAAALARMPALGVRTSMFDPQVGADELDTLWSKVRPTFPSAVARNAAYLVPRYPSGPAGPYSWIAARRNGVLAGVAVLREPRAEGDERLKGIRVATLADLLCAPADPAATLALLGGAEQRARALAADAILATASLPAHHRLLRRQAYLPLGGNVHFLFRNAAQDSSAFGSALTAWWLQRGDGGADDAL